MGSSAGAVAVPIRNSTPGFRLATVAAGGAWAVARCGWAGQTRGDVGVEAPGGVVTGVFVAQLPVAVRVVDVWLVHRCDWGGCAGPVDGAFGQRGAFGEGRGGSSVGGQPARLAARGGAGSGRDRRAVGRARRVLSVARVARSGAHPVAGGGVDELPGAQVDQG